MNDNDIYNLLPGLFGDPKQEQRTRAVDLSNMLAGPNAIARVGGYYLPQQASRFKSSLGKLASGATGREIETADPRTQFFRQVAEQNIGMDSAANLREAANIARGIPGLEKQALQLNTLANMAAKSEQATKLQKDTVTGLQNAVVSKLGDNQTAINAIKKITDTDVLTEFFKELNKPENTKRNTEVITVIGNDDKPVLRMIDKDSGEKVADLGQAPAEYAATVQTTGPDGKLQTKVLNELGEVMNTFSGVTTFNQQDLFMEAFREQQKLQPGLNLLDFKGQWEAAGNVTPQVAEYEYAMKGLEEGDPGYMPFGAWLDRSAMTSNQKDYERAKDEGYEGNFMQWLADNDRSTLEKEIEAARRYGWEGTVQQWVELGGSKNVNLPSVPTGYRLVTRTDEDGNTIYEAEKIGGIGMSALEAGRLALVTTGLEAAVYFSEFLFNDDGSVNNQNLALFQANQFIAVPGAGRTMDALFKEAIEAKLRLETGAAAPDTEVERLNARLRPNVLDTPETIRFKQLMLHRFLDQSYGFITGEPGFDEEGGYIETGLPEHRAVRRSRTIVNDILAEIDRYEQTGQMPSEAKSVAELRSNLR